MGAGQQNPVCRGQEGTEVTPEGSGAEARDLISKAFPALTLESFTFLLIRGSQPNRRSEQDADGGKQAISNNLSASSWLRALTSAGLDPSLSEQKWRDGRCGTGGGVTDREACALSVHRTRGRGATQPWSQSRAGAGAILGASDPELFSAV